MVPLGGSLSGTVKTAAGSGIAGVLVSVYRESGDFFATATTAANGTWGVTGMMADQLAQLSKTLTAIGNKPAIELTPEDIAVQIKRASLDMLRDSSDLFRQGRKDLDTATGRLAAIVGRVRTEDEQKRQTWLFAGVGVLAGILLWAILPGTIARAMPESWHWPEWMARKAVGEPTIIEAGIRLIRSQNPEAWEELARAQRILTENREALERCKEQAREAERTISCSIDIASQ